MSGIDLTAVMDALAAATQTVLASGFTAYATPSEGLREGDAVVGYPQDPINLTQTFKRGFDRATFPVWRIAGIASDERVRDAVADLITGSGSLVTAIEGYSTGAWSDVAVRTARVELYGPIGQPPLLALRFDCDVLS